jgi:hypothetical protein
MESASYSERAGLLLKLIGRLGFSLTGANLAVLVRVVAMAFLDGLPSDRYLDLPAGADSWRNFTDRLVTFLRQSNDMRCNGSLITIDYASRCEGV